MGQNQTKPGNNILENEIEDLPGGADVNDVLIFAARKGEIDVVRHLLLAEPGINVNARSRTGNTALMQAARKGHIDVVRQLLAVPGINVNARSRTGNTALMHAARKGHIDVVRQLLAVPGINVNAREDEEGNTALLYAAWGGHLAVVAELLAVPGIDVNARDEDGYTAWRTAEYVEERERRRTGRRRLKRALDPDRVVQQDPKRRRFLPPLPGGADSDDLELLLARIQIADMENEEKEKVRTAARRAERAERVERAERAERAEREEKEEKDYIAAAMLQIRLDEEAERAAERAERAERAAREAERQLYWTEEAAGRSIEPSYVGYFNPRITHPYQLRRKVYSLSRVRSENLQRAGEKARDGIRNATSEYWIDYDALQMLAENEGLCIYVYNTHTKTWQVIGVTPENQECQDKKYMFLEFKNGHYNILNIKPDLNVDVESVMNLIWSVLRTNEEALWNLRGEFFDLEICPGDGDCGYWAYLGANRYEIN